MENIEKELRKILSMVYEGYSDSIVTALEEDEKYKKSFAYTLAAIHFINELKSHNIVVELNDVFTDTVIEKFFREVSNFMER